MALSSGPGLKFRENRPSLPLGSLDNALLTVSGYHSFGSNLEVEIFEVSGRKSNDFVSITCYFLQTLLKILLF